MNKLKQKQEGELGVLLKNQKQAMDELVKNRKEEEGRI